MTSSSLKSKFEKRLFNKTREQSKYHVPMRRNDRNSIFRFNTPANDASADILDTFDTFDSFAARDLPYLGLAASTEIESKLNEAFYVKHGTRLIEVTAPIDELNHPEEDITKGTLYGETPQRIFKPADVFFEKAYIGLNKNFNFVVPISYEAGDKLIVTKDLEDERVFVRKLDDFGYWSGYELEDSEHKLCSYVNYPRLVLSVSGKKNESASEDNFADLLKDTRTEVVRYHQSEQLEPEKCVSIWRSAKPGTEVAVTVQGEDSEEEAKAVFEYPYYVVAAHNAFEYTEDALDEFSVTFNEKEGYCEIDLSAFEPGKYMVAIGKLPEHGNPFIQNPIDNVILAKNSLAGFVEIL